MVRGGRAGLRDPTRSASPTTPIPTRSKAADDHDHDQDGALPCDGEAAVGRWHRAARGAGLGC